MTDHIIAPGHETDLEEMDPHIFEGVAYSPLKLSFLCNYDPESPVWCKSCDWERTAEDLPEDAGRVQPDCCPACAKRGELGWVRSQPLGAKPEVTVDE